MYKKKEGKHAFDQEEKKENDNKKKVRNQDLDHAIDQEKKKI